ncbi:hypothetical protein AAFC00_004185 [Neodothiora populina]|uniref:TLC domain-containing protein n=1 Tax=Neodothiora populina TaxID=2781224 RepID=A0ABR3PIU2_9PEZI
MRDPFIVPAPEWVIKATTPIAERLALPTLPFHIHEIFLAFCMYQTIHSYISPALSRLFVPQRYAAFNKRTRINWDVHTVSLTQSLIVNSVALYLIFYDEERKNMNWAGRIWGYDGASGMLQGLAGGYFIWDLIITIRWLDIFGVGMLMHAISAVTVFSLGFRPFLNYYGPVFVLYELSSPALNMHWFMDKLQLTGSIYQLINGIILISTFFFCRLVWGSINSVYVFTDIWHAMQHTGLGDDMMPLSPDSVPVFADATGVMQFAGRRELPVWLALSYLASNIVLNVLNYYWFYKMIQTLRSRFEPPLGTKRAESKSKSAETKQEILNEEPLVQKGVFDDGRKTLEIQGRELRSRRRG